MSAPDHPAGRAEPVTVFRHGYWDVPADVAMWCPECNLPSARYVDRRMALVDEFGATSMRIGRGLYCFDHEDFLAPMRSEQPR